MANLSQEKRQRMLAFLETIREEHKDDDKVLIALGEIESELNAKKYGLVWERHEEAVDVQMRDNIPVFTECMEKEITSATGSVNFLLEGDNLHSLRLLEKTHAGKIDVIYIDPPYNTGNKDFKYGDKFIDAVDGFRHSKWISFIAERLQYAYRLLSDSGCIMISINDIEYAQLKLLCDDLFGEAHYIGTFIWKSRQNKDNRNITGISVDHEYILTYAKSVGVRNFKGGERQTERYTNPDNDPRGPWTSGNMVGIATEEQRPNLHYDFIDHKTGINYGKPAMGWRYDKNTMKRLVDEDRIIFPDSPNGRPRRKVFLSDVKEVRPGYSSIVGTDIYTRNGTADINDIFKKRVFDFPKPEQLIRDLLNQTTTKESIILDFFAGSGTTGHAVLKLNAEDGGNRRFILCTNNENNICEEITYERIKRVIEGYGNTEGIPANLKYYRTDFVSKDSDSITDELLNHIMEMIQLEHGIKLDGSKYIMVLSDEEADSLEQHWDEYKDVRALYVSRNVLFTTEQNKLFSEVDIHIIPDDYFKFELQEVGESW
ncbi:MAG: site-specific DNA-methyltransferase [Eubacteriales bacterium]|nr:site-specific DNA-methyltransferase [Eubacteriales bacterium]